MNKLFIAAMLLIASLSAKAQMINSVNFAEYAKHQYGNNWKDAALNARFDVEMDNQGKMVSSKVINAPGMTKAELYVEMANWFISNYDNSIQFADKESGVLIARPFIENVAEHSAGFNAYKVSINPTVRVQVQYGKILVSSSLSDYYVVKQSGGGVTAQAIAVGATAAAVTGAIIDETSHSRRSRVVEHRSYGFGGHRTYTTVINEYRPHRALEDALLVSCIAGAMTNAPKDSEKWNIRACYPFVNSDSHKITSSKAFVMANAYSHIVMDNIEKAIKQCELAFNK